MDSAAAAVDGSGHPLGPPRRAISSLLGRSSALSRTVAAIAGLAPHVLHHLGPLAGTALLAGAAGTVPVRVAGFVLSIPRLLRLRRRFGTWLAPAVATVIFVGFYVFSALIVGPAIAGADGPSMQAPAATPVLSTHDEHR